MTKVATAWRDRSGSSTPTTSETTDYLTTEAGDYLTTEAEDYLILTETTMTPKESTLWADMDREATYWRPRNSGDSSVATEDQYRSMEGSATDLRITEQGDYRILQETTITEKTPTEWTDE